MTTANFSYQLKFQFLPTLSSDSLLSLWPILEAGREYGKAPGVGPGEKKSPPDQLIVSAILSFASKRFQQK